jgi:hypothetical protein
MARLRAPQRAQLALLPEERRRVLREEVARERRLPRHGEMGRHYPAMSMIFVSDLLDSPGKIELEATAVIPEEK